ncbi:MAG: heparinase II/III family protein [Chloroflexota bacterium]
MPTMKLYRITIALKAFKELGGKTSFLFIWYQFLIRSGILKLLVPVKPKMPFNMLSISPLIFPDKESFPSLPQEAKNMIIAQADEIRSGKVHLFGGLSKSLTFERFGNQKHWTHHPASWVNEQDIKLIWEPARFSWATNLARAYYLTNDEKYAETFCETTEGFLAANPVNIGPHWFSAQEVALRLIHLTFCYSIFANSQTTTEKRKTLFAQAIAEHAARIPSTLIYARAQNNNHLLTEAAGLYTAAVILPNHPHAKSWHKLGWQWFLRGIDQQITADGVYVQHSTNYHRLMLQTALWFSLIAKIHGDVLPRVTTQRLVAATKWLYAMIDKESGRTPNLGPNDGAYILPLTYHPFEDYRPILQAAGTTFLGRTMFNTDEGEEMNFWLGSQTTETPTVEIAPPLILKNVDSWGVLRAAQFSNRPGHADQNHFDLWWRGLNIAIDAGTFLYNAPPPWQNALSSTDVHNTVTLNHQSQMTPAGRFLWLDWAQAQVMENSPTKLTAQHDGYRKFNLIHTRSVEIKAGNWQITDEITPAKPGKPIAKNLPIRLHWLLPDWPWVLDSNQLKIQSPHGWIRLQITSDQPLEFSLARAGELLHGTGEIPANRGWASPTYAVKKPVLSFAIESQLTGPLSITTTFSFPG